jgi:integrase
MLELRPNRSGTWYYRYHDANKKIRLQKIGRLNQITAPKARTQAKAMDKLRKAGGDVRVEFSPKPNTLTFGDFAERDYLPQVCAQNRSWQSTCSQVRRHLLPRIGCVPINRLTPADILVVQTQSRAAGLSVGTVNRLLIHLRTIFNAAIQAGHLPEGSNPAQRVRPLKGAQHRERYLTPNEVQRLFAALEHSRSPQLANIVRLLIYTGARKREILDARWEHVDLHQRVLTVPVSKSGRPRHICLSDAAVDIFNGLDRSADIAWVFPNPKTGKPLANLHNAWDNARRRAGLGDVRLHDLRHSFASFLVNAGHSLYEVQTLLGHQSPRMTMRYAHLSPQSLIRAANSVSQSLNQQPPSAA